MANSEPRDHDQHRDHDDPRSRTRQRDKDRDRDRDHDRDRDRSLRHSRHRSPSGLSGVVRDVDRLAYSLSRAGAWAYSGAVGTLGDLVVNLADTLHSPSRSDRYDRDDDRDRDRDRSGRRPRASSAERSRSVSSDVYGDISQALRDTADLASDSLREFSQTYNDELDRDDDEEDRIERADEDVAKPERPRPRHRPSGPPEPKETA